MDKPKPCPFCGGENIRPFCDKKGNWYWGCMPPGCLTLVGYFGTKAAAIKCWNRRAKEG